MTRPRSMREFSKETRRLVAAEEECISLLSDESWSLIRDPALTRVQAWALLPSADRDLLTMAAEYGQLALRNHQDATIFWMENNPKGRKVLEEYRVENPDYGR